MEINEPVPFDTPTDQPGAPIPLSRNETAEMSLDEPSDLTVKLLPLIAGLAAFVLIVSIPASYLVYRIVSTLGAPQDDGPALEEVLVGSIDEPVKPEVVPPDAVEATEVVPVPSEEPEQATPPPPQPAPRPRPAPSTAATFVQAGWAKAGSDPARARESFAKALALEPSNHEARYGHGYSLLKLGDTAGATSDLCAARGSSESDVERDVRSLIRRNGLSCP